jgi:integrase
MTTTPEPLGPPTRGDLTAAEAYYAGRARAANTVRGYRSDWADWCTWAAAEGVSPLPAASGDVARYLVTLAAAGANVRTLGRRISSIASAHRLAGHASPTDDPRVQLVWEGIRREHRSPVDQAPPLMPPVLWDVLDGLPTGAAGERDAALLLVGFIGALRRSELAAARIEDLVSDDRGLVLEIPASKTDQRGAGQLVVLPRSGRPARCPVTALHRWIAAAGADAGPIFRPVHRTGAVQPRAMSEAAINRAIQRACDHALGPNHGFVDGRRYSAHSLRAGFATFAAERGLSERAIARQTRHQSTATLAQYVRHASAWTDNAAAALGI